MWLCGISFGVDTRGWGPAGNTGRGWSWLRSGREHWAGILAVEVRQGTLGLDGRGWGPAGNTGRGWSWLRSGREHWAWMVVVEVRQRTLCVEGRSWAGGRGGRGGTRREEEEEEGGRGGRGEEQATDIKSNNPHQAGGELSTLQLLKQTLVGATKLTRQSGPRARFCWCSSSRCAPHCWHPFGAANIPMVVGPCRPTMECNMAPTGPAKQWWFAEESRSFSQRWKFETEVSLTIWCLHGHPAESLP